MELKTRKSSFIRLFGRNEAIYPPGLDDDRFENRDVLVGVIRGKGQFDCLVKHKFYHIPMSKLIDCEVPVKYIAIYQSQKHFGRKSGINIYGEVESCKTVKRCEITEIPKQSDELYMYFKIKRWTKLSKHIKAKAMDEVAFSTTMFLLKNCKDSTELKVSSKEEFEFYNKLMNIVKMLVRNRISDYADIVYRDFTLKIKNGMIYLYFVDALEVAVGFDVFLEEPMNVIKHIFDYYPEN